MGYIEKASRLGGVLNNAELALATATEAEVLNGKTFYSGNKELKTGVLVPNDLIITQTVTRTYSYAAGGSSFTISAPSVSGYTVFSGGITHCYGTDQWYFSVANCRYESGAVKGQYMFDSGSAKVTFTCTFYYLKDI